MKIDSGRKLLKFLDETIKVAVNKAVQREANRAALERHSLEEKDKQDATVDDIFKGIEKDQGSGDDGSKLAGDEAKGKGDVAPKEEPKKAVAPSAETRPERQFDKDVALLKKGNVTTDHVIEKLNTIRAGKSFRDEGISDNMEKYVSELTRAERTALLAFLKGIAQIMTGEVSGDQAVDPGDPEPDVSMKKGKGAQKKTVSVNVNVIKKPKTTSEEEAKEPKPKEDTTEPRPITPKPKKVK